MTLLHISSLSNATSTQIAFNGGNYRVDYFGNRLYDAPKLHWCERHHIAGDYDQSRHHRRELVAA